MSSRSNPRWPVYVISKGRWELPLTIRALQERGIPFRVVVEPEEADPYRLVAGAENVLVLPFSNLGFGSIPARNWVWEHSISEGYDWHWILDDNMRDFYYWNENLKIRTSSGWTFRVIEDFVESFTNIAMAGMEYELLSPRKLKRPPLSWNRRIYSCTLIRNELPFRWRGRYNEDTDLSLRILKAGWCTVLFNAFLADKAASMLMRGGNTDTLYAAGAHSRAKMTLQVEIAHPHEVTAKWKWGRWQHNVRYPRALAHPILKPGAKPFDLAGRVRFYNMKNGE